MNLTLQQIFIVGSCSEQVKFSELTIDMFRMLQTLEREGTDDYMYDPSPREREYSDMPPRGKYNSWLIFFSESDFLYAII